MAAVSKFHCCLVPMPNFGTVPTFYLTIRDVEVLRFSDFESPRVKVL
jgi:hypothetical protein